MKKTLVAYFSASGVTAKVAQQMSKAIGADLYEIKPKIAYTHEDLDWKNAKSRSSVEMKNKSFRPEIVDDKADIDLYDTVFVGFPIWWYVAPTIINTFLEAYDFSGKTVVVFATSGSSGFGNTVDELAVSLGKDTRLVEGKILNGKYTDKELFDWANTIAVL